MSIRMSIRGRIILAVLWVVSLVAIGVFASAQGRQDGLNIISGNDIGFKPEAVQRTSNRITGTLVVRVNGQWVDTQFTSMAVPAYGFGKPRP